MRHPQHGVTVNVNFFDGKSVAFVRRWFGPSGSVLTLSLEAGYSYAIRTSSRVSPTTKNFHRSVTQRVARIDAPLFYATIAKVDFLTEKLRFV